MKKLPMLAREQAIRHVASDLIEFFQNGSRDHMRRALFAYPKSEALGILARMFRYAEQLGGQELRDNLTNYFGETA